MADASLQHSTEWFTCVLFHQMGVATLSTGGDAKLGQNREASTSKGCIRASALCMGAASWGLWQQREDLILYCLWQAVDQGHIQGVVNSGHCLMI